MDDGWRILNAEHYQKEMRKYNRRYYQAKWMRDHRKKGSGEPIKGETVYDEAKGDGASEQQLDGIVTKHLPC